MALPKFKLRVEHLDELLREVSALQTNIGRHIGGAIHTEAELLMTQAKDRTPVQTGALKNSGHVRPPEELVGRVSVEMGFGGPAGSGQGQNEDVGYAIYVHEDLTAHHNVGQAKFLESVINENRDTISTRVAARLRRRIKLGL